MPSHWASLRPLTPGMLGCWAMTWTRLAINTAVHSLFDKAVDPYGDVILALK